MSAFDLSGITMLSAIASQDSVQHIEEQEIVVPSWAAQGEPTQQEKQQSRPAPRPQQPRPAATASPAATVAPDTLAAPADSVKKTVKKTHKSLILTMPGGTGGRPSGVVNDTWQPGSWSMLLVVVMFLAICFRFKHNYKYFRNIFGDIGDIGERRNIFKGTVRETSFMILLNFLACISVGLALFVLIGVNGAEPAREPGAIGIWICFGVAVAYGLVMPLMYRIVGYIFTEEKKAAAWTKAFLSSQALLGVILLIPALLGVFYPNWGFWILFVIGVLVGLVKLVFIFTGLRIFITRFASLLAFLYYLCSLEVVPLLLMYFGAIKLCDIFA